MGDIVFIGLFLACCAVTAGLVALCDRLLPPAERASPGGEA